MTSELALLVQEEWDRIPRILGTKPPVLTQQKHSGTFYADMDHEYQKHHEEDAVAAVMDALATAGWKFRFQYDSEFSSSVSFTRREMFVFEK